MSCPNFDFSSHLRYHQAGFYPWKRILTKCTMTDISQISVLATSPLLFFSSCLIHTSNRSNFHFTVANTWQRIKGTAAPIIHGVALSFLGQWDQITCLPSNRQCLQMLSCPLFSIHDPGMSPLLLSPCQETTSSHSPVSPHQTYTSSSAAKHFFQISITYFINRHF